LGDNLPVVKSTFQSTLSNPTTQVFLFDLDGTLRHNRPSSVKALYDYAVVLGIKDGPNRRKQAARWTHYYWAQSKELAQDIHAYGALNDPFWENYVIRSLTVFDCPYDTAKELAPELHRFMQEEHKPEDYVPPEVPNVLETLKGNGYRLGVLSNRNEPCQDHLERLGLIDYFELALVAGEVSAWKPDPRIFEHALQRMNASAEQTVYVGDNYFADVIGAKRAGIQPILLDPQNIFSDVDCLVISKMDELIVGD
jgi:HAD superfamily hydrolase (TIGR01549 family)